MSGSHPLSYSHPNTADEQYAAERHSAALAGKAPSIIMGHSHTPPPSPEEYNPALVKTHQCHPGSYPNMHSIHPGLPKERVLPTCPKLQVHVGVSAFLWRSSSGHCQRWDTKLDWATSGSAVANSVFKMSFSLSSYISELIRQGRELCLVLSEHLFCSWGGYLARKVKANLRSQQLHSRAISILPAWPRPHQVRIYHSATTLAPLYLWRGEKYKASI